MDAANFLQKHFAAVDYVVFSSLLICSALIGVYLGFFAKQKQNTTKEYLLGGKTIGIFPISMSMISSLISGTSLLVHPAEIYVYGTQFYMVTIGEIIANFTAMGVYLPVFYALEITSTYEYLKLRFNEPVKILGSLMFLLKMFLYVPIAMYTPALALNQVTGINIHMIIPIICFVCIFYTTVGGLKAVVWTDTLQTVLMYGGVATVMVLGTIRVGGVSAVFERNRQSDRLEFFNMDPDPTRRFTFWIATIGDMTGFLALCSVNQAMVQRCLAMPSLRSAKYTVMIMTLGMFCIITMSCYTGLVLYAFFEGCDPVSTKTIGKADQLLPLFVMQISESVPGLPGLFVAGVFSAALSSMSSCLNSMAGVIFQDMIKPLMKRPITELTASNILKVVAALIGLICAGLVFLVEKADSLFALSVSLTAITAGALLGVFTLGMFFPWANSIGAMCGGISSMLLVSWMSVGSQAAHAKGSIVHAKKPVFNDQCPEGFNNQTLFDSLPTEEKHDDVFYLYRISSMYYTLIGVVTVLVVGMAVSFLTGFRDPRDLDRNLLTPLVHRFLPKRPILPEEEKMREIAADFQSAESLPKSRSSTFLRAE